MKVKLSWMMLGLVFTAGGAWAATPFAIGQVVAAIGSGQVRVYTPTGTTVQTLNDGTGSTYTTGMAFDAAGNLYVTNFSTSNTSKFDANANLVAGNFMSGGQNSPESIATDQAGHFYVGGPSTPHFYQFNSSGGTPSATYNTACADGNGGTDWLDLAADQHTIFFTCEGTAIHSFNTTTNTANANFASSLPATVYALRIIPSGTFAGNVLVAASNNALMVNSSGTVMKTYTLPGNGGADFALNLDPNGTDFWTADLTTGTIWALNISSGAVVHQFTTGFPNSTAGLTVVGQLTAGGGGGTGGVPTTPAPASLILTLTALAGLSAFWGLRKLSRLA